MRQPRRKLPPRIAAGIMAEFRSGVGIRFCTLKKALRDESIP
jgi:hypothetical protein